MKRLKAHERHPADVPLCCVSLRVDDKDVHSFEHEKRENMKKEEIFCFTIVLAAYDSSNA